MSESLLVKKKNIHIEKKKLCPAQTAKFLAFKDFSTLKLLFIIWFEGLVPRFLG